MLTYVCIHKTNTFFQIINTDIVNKNVNKTTFNYNITLDTNNIRKNVFLFNINQYYSSFYIPYSSSTTQMYLINNVFSSTHV